MNRFTLLAFYYQRDAPPTGDRDGASQTVRARVP